MRAKRWAARRAASVDTPTPLRAIETRFDGYRFRSRLEARWAVFFKTLGVRYEYEKEGYDLGAAGWYLPDFWLPDLAMWAEVKAQDFSPQELKKAQYLASASGHQVLRLIGTPQYTIYWATCSQDSDIEYILDDQYLQNEKRWFNTPGCAPERVAEYYGLSKRAKAAYEAARSARFEHGARG